MKITARLSLVSVGRCKGRGRLQSGLGEEALRERRQIPVRQIEFDAFNAMHGKEDHGGSERLAVPHHHGQILKGGEFGSAQAEALWGESKDHAPKFLARIAQGRNDEGTSHKGLT